MQLPGTPSRRQILAMAVPIMLSNVTTPLIGVVDTAIVGQVPDAALIGAVALGATLFSFVFWAFGFLRMGTTGLAAQALGADDQLELAALLVRALGIAAAIGCAIIALQWPIGWAAFRLLEAPAGVESLARDYFTIRIWAAPFTLVNYAVLGWLIGRGRAGTALIVQLVLNLSNIALDAVFVLELGLGVRGVAWGTLCAEVIAAVVGVGFAWSHLRGARPSFRRIASPAALRRMLGVNTDIMVRSLALLMVFVFFVAEGARQGEAILAANAILMHFISVCAYFLDGIAYATESFVGRAVGRRAADAVRGAIAGTTQIAVGFAMVATAALGMLGPWFVELMTTDPVARATAHSYLWWAVFAPLAGVWCFQLDGVFIGATRTADMRNAMIMSTAVFFAAWWLLLPLGNHGLWAALYVHYAARTTTLLGYYPRLVRAVHDG